MILTTSLSVIYQNLTAQLILTLTAILLLISIQPCKHKLYRVWKRLTSLGKIILTIMIFQVIFRRQGEVIWEYSVLRITHEGVIFGVVSSLRFFIIIVVAGLLFDISYYDYLLAFKSWKIPYEISFLVASVIHFLPIFSHQYQRSLEALKLRGIDLGRINLFRRLRIYPVLIFPVIARAIAEVRWRAISLELRAFRLYPTRTYLHEKKLGAIDLSIQIISMLIFCLILVIY